MRRHHISSLGSSSSLLFSIDWRGDQIPYDFSKFMYTDNCTFGDLSDHAYAIISDGSTPSSNGLGYIVDNYGTNPLYILSGGYLKNALSITTDANGNAINNNYIYIYSPLVTDYIGQFCFPISVITNTFNYVGYYDTVDATLNYYIYLEGGSEDEGGEGGESSGGDEGSSTSGGNEGGEAEIEVPLEEAENETEVPYEGEGSDIGGGDEGGEGEEVSPEVSPDEGEEPSEEEQE